MTAQLMRANWLRSVSLHASRPPIVKIAYIDHSYHAQTGSTTFFLDLLKDVAEVDVYLDDGWLGRDNVNLREILARNYDAIVLFQVERHAKLLNDSQARVIFVPMYDSCLPFSDDFWKELTRIEILCFCRALYERLDHWGLRARYTQFFPDPARFEVNAAPEHAGFFWSRRPEPSWQTVKSLLGDSRLSWINIHQAYDPSVVHPTVISDEDQARHRLRFTAWSEDKVEYTRILQKAGIFFAPRLHEGIGMAFLESMAMGKAVVAADNPTMNEYITHRVNGYLYDPDDPQSIDLSRFQEIGLAARQSMERGHLRWKRSRQTIAEWLITGAWPERHPARLNHTPNASSVSVITLAGPDNDAIERTRLSVAAQNLSNIEQIIAASPSARAGLPNHSANYLTVAANARRSDILNAAAAAAKGDWLIFLDAGDVLIDENALNEALEDNSTRADFITCHYMEGRGARELMHWVAQFDDAVERLSLGRLDRSWFAKLPVLPATLINKRVFERDSFSSRFRLAGDIDFFLRCKRKGAIFRHGNTTLSCIRAHSWDAGLRRTAECRRVFLRETSNPKSVEALCASLNQADCDPLLNSWTRLGPLSLGLNLMRHPPITRYAVDRTWRRLQFLGIRGIVLRQLLWFRSKIRPSCRPTTH